MIARDQCDYCHTPFADGEKVFKYTMTGSAPEFDGVAGEQIYLHAPCALAVKDILDGRSHDEQMKLSHQFAMTIKGMQP